MNIRISLAILLLLGLYSCSETTGFKQSKNKVEPRRFLIHLQHYFSDEESNVSFPIWFDDSIIRSQNIQKITRRIYALNQDTSEVSTPRVIKSYFFSQEGELLRMSVKEFYEGYEVESVTFRYLSVKDENGYASVEFEDKKHRTKETHEFELYQKEKYQRDYLTYKNKSDDNYLFFVLNEAHWGALSIDSLIHPLPEDKITLGGPLFPVKQYHVENRVNEFQVREVDYIGTNSPFLIRFDNGPLRYHRRISYNEHGFCSGFVDSTFSIDRFLMERHSTFKLNSNHLPLELEHSSKRTKDQPENRQLETFEYEYYN